MSAAEMTNAGSVLLIAEAGVNHNGDLGLAIELVHAGAEAGADIVKFQTFKANQIVTRDAPKAEYQKVASGTESTQYEMLKDLELSSEMHCRIKEECESCGVEFLSTGFDIPDIDFLIDLGIKRVKIPSGEINHIPYLRHIANIGLPIILSTGMCTLGEVRNAVETLLAVNKNLILNLLHCNTAYPTPFADVNLRAMNSLASEFQLPVGYSDHTPGINISIAAAALGAAIIEKHFTLDRTLPGPDHRASLEPDQLKALVQGVREVEQALGSTEKICSNSEEKNLAIARRSIVAASQIRKGEVFTEDNICCKRPGTGISAASWDKLLGKRASRDFLADERIE